MVKRRYLLTITMVPGERLLLLIVDQGQAPILIHNNNSPIGYCSSLWNARAFR